MIETKVRYLEKTYRWQRKSNQVHFCFGYVTSKFPEPPLDAQHYLLIPFGKCRRVHFVNCHNHSENLFARHDRGCQQVPRDIPGLFVHEVRKVAVLKDTFTHVPKQHRSTECRARKGNRSFCLVQIVSTCNQGPSTVVRSKSSPTLGLHRKKLPAS